MEDDRQPASRELLESLRRLSDDELVARVKTLAARERRATALLVAHLAELDTRDLHLRAGCPSLFVYCRDVLALSDHEAYNRMEVARTARRFPAVLDLLAAGAVNLTTVRLLGPHLTAENHAGVLESACGKRKAEVEEIVARLAPRPDVPASVRKLPVRSGAACPALGPCSSGAASPTPPADVQLAPPADALPLPAAEALLVRAESSPETSYPGGVAEPPPAAVAPRLRALHEASAAVTPLSPDRYRYQLTIGNATLEKLRLAKDLLRHILPSGDDEAILDRALALLLDDLAQKKRGSEESGLRSSGENGRPSRRAAKGSRHVPAAVRRAVWVRDRGRCAFVAEDGRRCGARAFVEFHHLRPYAAGGEATAENIELRCRRHNAYEARLFFPRPEDRAFVLERNGAGGTAASPGDERSTTTSPAALPRAVGRQGPTPTLRPSRGPRQAMREERVFVPERTRERTELAPHRISSGATIPSLERMADGTRPSAGPTHAFRGGAGLALK